MPGGFASLSRACLCVICCVTCISLAATLYGYIVASCAPSHICSRKGSVVVNSDCGHRQPFLICFFFGGDFPFCFIRCRLRFFLLQLPPGPSTEDVQWAAKRPDVVRMAAVKIAMQKGWAKNRKKNRISVSARAKMKAARAQIKERVTGRDKHKERSRYWMATRQAFSGCNRVAVAVDASRVGGRKRSSFALLNCESGVAAWAPPQAHFLGGDLRA